MEIRCEAGKLHGILVEPGVVEFKCDRPGCGAGSGVVVLHRFDAFTGDLIDTLRFKEPQQRKEMSGAAQHDSAAVRPA